MTRGDVPYAVLVGFFGVVIFMAGRYSVPVVAPVPAIGPQIIYLPAPQVASSIPESPPSPPVEALTPTVRTAVQSPPARPVQAPLPTSVKTPPPPEVMVLEEIPDNPYRAQK